MTRSTVQRLLSSTLVRWIFGAVILAAFLAITPYRAVDRHGAPRIRTAPQVWQLVDPAAKTEQAPPWITVTYRAALAVTVAGAFLLMWSGLRVGGSGGGPRSAVQSTTADVARLLRSGAASVTPAKAVRWAAAALSLFVAWKLGAFVLSQADTFVTTDHPFHIARAETLRRSLQGGEVLRWVAHHQGGYPVEFYPLGFAYVEVALWVTFLGLLSMLVIHKLAVILLLLAPALLFWYMARADGRPPLVALLAFVVHVAVPGSLWEGGFTELVTMGLVTNVAGAICSLASFIGMAALVGRASAGSFALAALAAAGALWVNPRAGFGLLACGAGVWAMAALRAQGLRYARIAVVRIAMVALIAALLAAPEVLSLLRYGSLYHFVQYTGYTTAMDYFGAAMNAVSPPVFVFAIIGGWAALAAEERPISRAVALTLIVYVVVTATVSFNAAVAALVPQLEATRLMPLQRMLTIYLAAVGAHVVARACTRGRNPRAGDALQVGVAGALLLAFGIPFAVVPAAGGALQVTERSSNPEMVTFTDALKTADRVTPAGTAILIVGSNLSIHEPLWAPVVAERPYFYDDWMWYWHTSHHGPYNPFRGSAYEAGRIKEVFSRDYLQRNAIGSVLVAEAAAPAAAASPNLRLVFSGTHSLYLVERPVSFVTFGERSAERVQVSNHLIRARGVSDGGYAAIRRNWFPRWRAVANGRPVSVERTASGYMRVRVPPGPVDLELTYVIEPLDWTARGAAAAGLLLLAAVLVRLRRA